MSRPAGRVNIKDPMGGWSRAEINRAVALQRLEERSKAGRSAALSAARSAGVAASAQRLLGARRLNARTGGFLGQEKKFVDSARSFTVPTTLASAEADDGTMLCLNGIAQGDGESQRDGRKCHLTRVDIHGHVGFESVADQPTEYQPYVRILLIHDKQTNGAQFNSEDVLAATPGGTAINTCAFRNLQYTSRFAVLDEVIVQCPPRPAFYNQPATQVDCPALMVPFKMGKDLNLDVTFTGTGATVASIADNSLHLMAIKSQSQQGDVICEWVSRVRFVG